MAPIKRPATSAFAVPAAKKHHCASKAKLAAIAKALKGTDTYPHSVLTMLSQHIDLSLGAAKEERHEYQARFVEMIGEVLSSIQKKLDDQISEAEGKVAQADGEKELRETRVTEATAAIGAAAETLKAAETVAHEASAKHHDAQKTLAAAKHEQKQGDASLDAAATKKEKLELVASESLEPVKNGTLEADKVKAAIASITKAGKEFSFDNALVTSFASALSKPAAERGTFDAVVIEQLEAEFKKHIDGFATQLSEGAAGREERASKVAHAASEHEAAVETQKAADAALDAARKQSKEADLAQKAAIKLLKQFGPEMKNIQASLNELKETRAEFQAGVLADYKELAERSIQPPPEAEAAPAPAEDQTTA